MLILSRLSWVNSLSHSIFSFMFKLEYELILKRVLDGKLVLDSNYTEDNVVAEDFSFVMDNTNK